MVLYHILVVFNILMWGSVYNTSFEIVFLPDDSWDENNQTRVISDSSGFYYANNDHANEWIFSNASFGDSVQIGVQFDNDHTFETFEKS